MGQVNFWKESAGLSCVDCKTSIATTYTNQKYVIEVIYHDKCIKYDTVEIIVVDTNELYVPNAFSPSAKENENTVFRVYANKLIRAKLIIFNRWGEKVFETNNGHLDGWDGNYLGEPAPMGVYLYHLEATFFNRRKEVRKGTFTLLR